MTDRTELPGDWTGWILNNGLLHSPEGERFTPGDLRSLRYERGANQSRRAEIRQLKHQVERLQSDEAAIRYQTAAAHLEAALRAIAPAVRRFAPGSGQSPKPPNEAAKKHQAFSRGGLAEDAPVRMSGFPPSEKINRPGSYPLSQSCDMFSATPNDAGGNGGPVGRSHAGGFAASA